MSKWFYSIVPILGVVTFVCMFFLFTGKVTVNINGFALDKNGNIYIGRDNEIVVYCDGKAAKSINPKTSRGYLFTISNETIILSTASTVYIMDLDGNVLSSREDKGTATYNELQRNMYSFTDQNGTVYKVENLIGRTKICAGEEVIYQIPMLDFVVKITLIGVIFATIIIVLLTLWRTKN